jgi:hypothetical protein
MVSKEEWGKPAAWAITQNEKLWSAFDSVTDRSVIVEWSLGDTYRTRMMEPGDRALFWVVGKNGGIARVGFVLNVRKTPKGYWKDAFGTRHQSPYSGSFFLPPFPNRRYIHRAALARKSDLAKCELLTTAAQAAPPLRIEKKEWRAIERLLIQFDRTNLDFRSAWPSG